MKFSVVVCTYMRPVDIIKMLDSIAIQTVYPDEIIIVDASINAATKKLLTHSKYQNLHYYFVDEYIRGAAKQRNFGITKVSDDIEIICFLDDDVVLLQNYFEELLKTYDLHPEALGVGGIDLNESLKWVRREKNFRLKFNEHYFDGWSTKEAARNLFRKYFGLSSNVAPGFMPLFSHGRNSFPPSGKIYPAELLISCVCSYRKSVLDNQKFDDYFVGYSLYEDTALSLKVAKTGKLFINTNAKLNHYHSSSGRPNKFSYGKMVVRNGWYVWRIKNPNPKMIDQLKWNSITILYMIIRASNIVNTRNHKEAFTDAIGRLVGWFSLLFDKPKNSDL